MQGTGSIHVLDSLSLLVGVSNFEGIAQFRHANSSRVEEVVGFWGNSDGLRGGHISEGGKQVQKQHNIPKFAQPIFC